MKTHSVIAVTIALAVLLAGTVQVAAAQANSNTTVQVGQVNINRTSQCGDTNSNTTYQDGRVNINQTNQGACARPSSGARARSPGHGSRGSGRPAHAAASLR
jgi:hypothetical protein